MTLRSNANENEFGYMLEHLSIRRYLCGKIIIMSDKAVVADNQQGRLWLSAREPSETTRQTPVTKSEIIAYLNGATHDATLNKGKRVRFGQKNRQWLEHLKVLLGRIGWNSWIYKEGVRRNLYVLETLCNELDFKLNALSLKSRKERIFYIRGFFDTEGGIPKNLGRFYIQLVQKNFTKIDNIKFILEKFGIKVGKVHNPSKDVNPDYWRIFILADSHRKFAEVIGSNHPEKIKIFRERMKI